MFQEYILNLELGVKFNTYASTKSMLLFQTSEEVPQKCSKVLRECFFIVYNRNNILRDRKKANVML